MMYETSSDSRLTNEQYRSRMTTLECFLRVYSMLSNFVEFLEFRGFKYHSVHYKKMPLQGALEISNEMKTSSVCENLFKCTTERPGLFINSFRNACCSKSACVSKDIINKIETIIKYFMKSSAVKNSTHIEVILFALSGLSCTAASKKLQILSVLLREAAENVVCEQTLKEPLARIQIKTLLNLVSNFIRKWKEKPCETQPRLKICKFCDNIINDETRRYTGKFCCNEAKYLNQLLNEWVSLHLSQDIPKFEYGILTDAKYEIDDMSTLEDHYRNHISTRIKTPTEVRDECRRDGARTTDAAAERIREKRDDNSYRRKLDGIDDKDYQQDRRPVQRDMEKEANGSRAAAGKKWRANGTMEDATTKGKDGEQRDRESRSPYRHRRAEKRRETRLPDSGVRKIGRLDRDEERREAVEISKNLAKRLKVERDGNGRIDRRENGEKLVARDRKKAKADKDEEEETTPLSKGKDARVKSKRTTVSLDDAEKGRTIIKEEEELLADTVKPDVTKKWKGTSKPIEYQLSNVHFVKLGWTVLPIIKTMRKIVQYEARPAKPSLDWFKKYRHKNTKYYDDGLTPFLRFHPDGSGELFYPNGVLAIRVYRPENRKYDMYTVFTPGGKDALGIERKSQILAIFDTLGHGVVFDEDGAARLSYNQIGGIFTDSPAGLPLAWTWNARLRESILQTTYTEKSAERLQMDFFSKSTKSSGNVKTPISPSNSRNKEKKVVEVQKPVVEQRQEEVETKSNFNQNSLEENIFRIKVICMKLNEFLGLRIIDQRNIVLRFSARNKSIRIELGTVLNFNKETAPGIVEAIDWKSDMLRCRFQEKLPTKLESDSSLHDLAREYRQIKRFAKERKAIIIKYRPFSKLSNRRIINWSCKRVKNNVRKTLI